jgi:3-oxoacyl-[acyl-carrier-protein] synthase II
MTTTTIAADELVLSAWSAVSPFGVDSAEFGAGVRAGQRAVATLDQDVYPGPFREAGLVPDFDVARTLGRKGTRAMDRLTAIAVTAVRNLVDQCGPGVTADPERIGLVLGTGWASVQTIMDTTTDSLTGDKPYHVDPARFPNTVMNKAAGQSAIWHTIRGPNTTITGDRLTGLLALSYAMRLIRGGHCDRVLCGAAEEYSVQRAWLEWHAGTEDGRPDAIGEGSAIFLLESFGAAVQAGRKPSARVRATRFRAYGDPADARATLADCVRDALRKADASPADVRFVAPLEAEGRDGTAEQAAIADVLGDAKPQRLRCRALTGDTSSVSTGFQIAAVFAASADDPLHPDELALVTAIDRDGLVGAALLGGCEPT